MKKILLLSLLLIGITSCCKDEDDMKISWNVGVYHDAIKHDKYLTFEMVPSRGKIQAVELSTLWTFSGGRENKKVLRYVDTEFNYKTINDSGIEAVTQYPVNYVLDDEKWSLKEVQLIGRVKVSGEWYHINETRTFI